MLIQHQEKNIGNDNQDSLESDSEATFAKNYINIAMKTLKYLMQVCNLHEYYKKIEQSYGDDTLNNTIKTLIRVKKMYKIIDSLVSHFKNRILNIV
jgi:hypothetical protein